MTHANEQHQQTDIGHDGATIETRSKVHQPQLHPYLVATITPGGGLIVHMYWLNQPAEPLAFTNEHDFSAWLKSAVAQCSGRIPQGIRPRSGVGGSAGASRPSLQHAPMQELPEFEEEIPKARAGLRGLLGGRS